MYTHVVEPQELPWETPEPLRYAHILNDLYGGGGSAEISYHNDPKGHPAPYRPSADPWVAHLSDERIAAHLWGQWWLDYDAPSHIRYYRVASYLHGHHWGCRVVVNDVDRHGGSDTLLDVARYLEPLYVKAASVGITMYGIVSGGGRGLHDTIYFATDRQGGCPVPLARRLLFRLMYAAGYGPEFERGLDDDGNGFDRIVPATDTLGRDEVGFAEWLPFAGHASGKFLDRWAPIRLNPDGTLVSRVEVPLVGYREFLDTVVRHTREQVEEALRRLAEEGHEEEFPEARRGQDRDDGSTATARSKDRAVSGGDCASEAGEVDWRAFLREAGVAFDVQADEWLYLRRCPFATHSGEFKFRVHRLSGWGACWVSHCEAADGVWPREWCRALGIELPRRRRRRLKLRLRK